jgi:hypothetical protein
MSHLIGQVATGCLADLVIWKPENFGAKPEMIIKGGVIAWATVRTSSSPGGIQLTLFPRLDGRSQCIDSNGTTGLWSSDVGRTTFRCWSDLDSLVEQSCNRQWYVGDP